MTTANPEKQEFRFTGKHMLAMMLAFFGVIISVNFYMATRASSSWTGLVVKNSYVASQQYNGELARASEQKARGWHSNVSFAAGTLAFTLYDKEGNILTLENATAEIGRPVFEQEDKTLQFMPVSTGGNKIMLHLAEGIWFIKITGVVNGNTYRRDIRMSVGDSGKGKIL